MYDNCMLSITAQRNGHGSKWEKKTLLNHTVLFLSSLLHLVILLHYLHPQTAAVTWQVCHHDDCVGPLQMPLQQVSCRSLNRLLWPFSAELSTIWDWILHRTPSPPPWWAFKQRAPPPGPDPPSPLLSVEDQPGSMGSSRCPPAAWLFETQQSLRWWICGRKLCWWADGFVKGQRRRFCKLSFLLSDALTSQSRRAVQSKDF